MIPKGSSAALGPLKAKTCNACTYTYLGSSQIISGANNWCPAGKGATSDCDIFGGACNFCWFREDATYDEAAKARDYCSDYKGVIEVWSDNRCYNKCVLCIGTAQNR